MPSSPPSSSSCFSEALAPFLGEPPAGRPRFLAGLFEGVDFAAGLAAGSKRGIRKLEIGF